MQKLEVPLVSFSCFLLSMPVVIALVIVMTEYYVLLLLLFYVILFSCARVFVCAHQFHWSPSILAVRCLSGSRVYFA